MPTYHQEHAQGTPHTPGTAPAPLLPVVKPKYESLKLFRSRRAHRSKPLHWKGLHRGAHLFQIKTAGSDVGMTISVITTNTPLVPSAGLLAKLRGAACLEQVWSSQYLRRKEKPPPWPPRPADDQSSPRKARAARRAAGVRTLQPGRRRRFSSRRPKHSSDRFRQVGGSKWKYSQQPRKVTPAPGAGRKVKRRTSPNAGRRGTREAGHGGPGAPGRAGTRARTTRTSAPREPAQLSPPRAPRRAPGPRASGGGPAERTHLRRSAPGRRAAAAAAAAGAG